MKKAPLGAAVLAVGVVAVIAPPSRGEDSPELARAKAAEARRVALVAKLSPCVGAFFQKATVGQGGGSGVVIDPRGYAITNFHVSSTEHELLVGLDDGRLYKATLLGIDPGGDIALAKLEGKPRFAFAEMGQSDQVRIGDRVLALGNPFLLATDFKPTVTEGIVSGVHRFRDASGGTDLVYGDCIQIDASINPGNSGGPLFDEAGRWIGINGLGGFRPDRGRVNVGVGYAASVDQIKNFLEDLRSGQQCEHGTMDATVRDLSDEDDPSRTLVKVDAIVQESVAYQAGLRLGDVLVDFSADGVTATPVRTQNQFLTLISRMPSGRRVRLTVDRRREDAQIGGGRNNYVRYVIGFRLKGVPSGPPEGRWEPDADAIAAETKTTLGGARRATNARLDLAKGVVLSGERRENGLTSAWRLVLQHTARGASVRLETTGKDGRTIFASDGTTRWRAKQDGTVEDWPQVEADLLEGTAVALAAVLREGGESDLTELKFTGGDSLAGERVSRIETRDKAGRRRKLYFSTSTGLLAGVAYPINSERWVEERWVFGQSGVTKLVRVDDERGDPIGEDVVEKQSAVEGDPFKKPEGR